MDMRDLEVPPSKNNLSVINIIQLIIMVCIGLEAGKGVFDLFKLGRFSIIDLIKIIVDALIFVGFALAAYGFFTDKSDSMKNGFKLFWYGLIAALVIFILDWIRDGFGFGSLIEFLFYGFIVYVLYLQCQRMWVSLQNKYWY